MPTDEVLIAWEFIKFRDDYEETAYALNRPDA